MGYLQCHKVLGCLLKIPSLQSLLPLLVFVYTTCCYSFPDFFVTKYYNLDGEFHLLDNLHYAHRIAVHYIEIDYNI